MSSSILDPTVSSSSPIFNNISNNNNNKSIVTNQLKGLLHTIESSENLNQNYTLPPIPDDIYADVYSGTTVEASSTQLYTHDTNRINDQQEPHYYDNNSYQHQSYPHHHHHREHSNGENGTINPSMTYGGNSNVSFMQMISPDMVMGIPPLTPGSVMESSPPMDPVNAIEGLNTQHHEYTTPSGLMVDPSSTMGYNYSMSKMNVNPINLHGQHGMNPLGIHFSSDEQMTIQETPILKSMNKTAPNFQFIQHSFSHSNPKRPISRANTSHSAYSNSHDMGNNHQNEVVHDDSDSAIALICQHPGCHKKFNKAANLRAHILTHAKERQFSCSDCGARFRRLPDLQRHHRSLHTDAKPFACPHNCGKSFARKDALKRHLECKSKGVPCAGFRRS